METLSHFIFWKMWFIFWYCRLLALEIFPSYEVCLRNTKQNEQSIIPIISIIPSFLCLFYQKAPNFPAWQLPLTRLLLFDSRGSSIALNIDGGERGGKGRRGEWIVKQKATTESRADQYARVVWVSPAKGEACLDTPPPQSTCQL